MKSFESILKYGIIYPTSGIFEIACVGVYDSFEDWWLTVTPIKSSNMKNHLFQECWEHSLLWFCSFFSETWKIVLFFKNRKIWTKRHFVRLICYFSILLPDLKNQLMFCLLMSYKALFQVLFIVNSILHDPFHSTKPWEGKATRKSMWGKGDFVKQLLPQWVWNPAENNVLRREKQLWLLTTLHHSWDKCHRVLGWSSCQDSPSCGSAAAPGAKLRPAGSSLPFGVTTPGSTLPLYVLIYIVVILLNSDWNLKMLLHLLHLQVCGSKSPSLPPQILLFLGCRFAGRRGVY